MVTGIGGGLTGWLAFQLCVSHRGASLEGVTTAGTHLVQSRQAQSPSHQLHEGRRKDKATATRPLCPLAPRALRLTSSAPGWCRARGWRGAFQHHGQRRERWPGRHVCARLPGGAQLLTLLNLLFLFYLNFF